MSGSQYSLETSEKQIELSIRKREHYNEFSVSHPQYAGLYVAIDEELPAIGIFGISRPPVQQDIVREMFLFGKEIQLPVFVIKNGIPYRAEWDAEQGKVVLGDALSKKNLLQEGRTVPPQEKASLLDEILEESPFKLESIERVFLDSRNAGRLFYIQTHAQAHPELFQEGSHEELPNDWNYTGFVIPDSPVTVLIDMPNINSPYNEHMKLFLADGKIYRWSRGRYELKHEDSTHISEITKENGKYIYMNSGGGETWSTSDEIKSTDDYLTAMRQVIEKVNQFQDAFVYGGGVRHNLRTDTLIRIAYHLYGYAAEARRVGDTDSAEEVERFAETLVPKSKVEELVKKRIRKDGNFRVTKEDLRVA